MIRKKMIKFTGSDTGIALALFVQAKLGFWLQFNNKLSTDEKLILQVVKQKGESQESQGERGARAMVLINDFHPGIHAGRLLDQKQVFSVVVTKR